MINYIPIKKIELKALEGIEKIRPFFHRINISFYDISFNDLKNEYKDKIAVYNYNVNDVQKVTNKRYRSKGMFELDTGNKVNIIFNNNDKYLPSVIASITHPTHDDLYELEDKLCNKIRSSRHVVSSVECTVDFMCKNDEQSRVGDLFYIFCRNYYAANAKRTQFFGGKYYGYASERDYKKEREGGNAVYAVHFSEKNRSESKRVKFYERGPDEAMRKNRKYWRYSACDRVRFEVTVKRTFLKNILITTINDVLRRPILYPVLFDECRPLFQFKRFIDKNYREYRPPVPDGRYNQNQLEACKCECFMEQVFWAKEKGLNIAQCLEDYDRFGKLVEMTKEAIALYEKEFIKNPIVIEIIEP